MHCVPPCFYLLFRIHSGVMYLYDSHRSNEHLISVRTSVPISLALFLRGEREWTYRTNTQEECHV